MMLDRLMNFDALQFFATIKTVFFAMAQMAGGNRMTPR
jgi:hypothetical protein